MSRLGLVRLSSGFEKFWPELASDLGAQLEEIELTEVTNLSPQAAVLIVAAAAEEREALRWLDEHALPSHAPTFVVGADPGRRTAMQCVQRGARDYFALPEDLEVFRNAVQTAVQQRAAAEIADAEPRADDGFTEIVGESPALRKEVERATRVVRHKNANILILGETGTGKELFARAIHQSGPRRDAPFVAVNCSALPEHLVESELFGHERGAFTNAHATKPGLFEVAHTGTLFLDEIGDLPLELQAKLLRVLEERVIRRLGGTKERSVDVQVIAATNEQLNQRVRDGTFRGDLFFRLNTVTLRLPPLRDRGNDVMLISEALLDRLTGEHEIPRPAISKSVETRLQRHSWPGNVRELRNALERALLLSPSGELDVEELVLEETHDSPGSTAGPIPFPAPLDEITSAAAHATVDWCGGNRAESARRLGISTRRLRRLLSGSEEHDGPELASA